MKVKVDGAIIKPNYDFLLVNNTCSKYMPIYLQYFMRYSHSNYVWPWVCHFKVTKVEVDASIRKPTYDFLLVNNFNYMPICSILWDIASQNVHDLEFDLSKSLDAEVIMVPLESPHVTSYWWIIVIICISAVFYKICMTLSLTFQGHWRSKLMEPLESPHMTSYQLILVNICISAVFLT